MGMEKQVKMPITGEQQYFDQLLHGEYGAGFSRNITRDQLTCLRNLYQASIAGELHPGSLLNLIPFVILFGRTPAMRDIIHSSLHSYDVMDFPVREPTFYGNNSRQFKIMSGPDSSGRTVGEFVLTVPVDDERENRIDLLSDLQNPSKPTDQQVNQIRGNTRSIQEAEAKDIAAIRVINEVLKKGGHNKDEIKRKAEAITRSYILGLATYDVLRKITDEYPNLSGETAAIMKPYPFNPKENKAFGEYPYYVKVGRTNGEAIFPLPYGEKQTKLINGLYFIPTADQPIDEKSLGENMIRVRAIKGIIRLAWSDIKTKQPYH